jgi:RNA polymerase sigma factor (sigma-70 family)
LQKLHGTFSRAEASMNVHISYKLQRTPDIDKEIHHWTEKVQKRLQVFRPELVHLKGLLEQNSPREGVIVSLNLRLPSGQMAVHESAPSAAAALKAAFDDLLGQIGRHKDLLRNSHNWQRRRSPNGRPPAEVPFEQTIASIPPLTATAEDVRSYVNANFRRLKLFVERELFFRESSAQLQPGSLSVEEIVDEAVARALDDKIEKPDRLGLEPWLYRLAIQENRVNLRSSRQRRNEQASDEQQLQFHQPDESVSAADSIADDRIATPEDIAYTDEMITLVQFALQSASRRDREAFILHGIEGFSLDEISAITDRKPVEVQESIRRAREKLRHSFAVNNPFKDRLLQQTGTD